MHLPHFLERFVLFRAFSWRAFITDLPRYIFLTLWMLTNIGIFVGYFIQFEVYPEYFYFRLISRQGLAFAKASAAVINFNSLLILLPVCRNLLSFIRGTCCLCSRSLRKTLDKNISYHIYFAYTIIIMSVVHTLAHYLNYEFIITDITTTTGNNFPTENNPIIFLGLQSVRNEHLPIDAVILCYTTGLGITGHILWIVLFLMFTSSLEVIRRSYFEIFWYTHHLYILFFIALGLHQFQSIIPVQSNVEEANPYNCSQLIPGICEPMFKNTPPNSYKWFVIPLAIYIFELLIRFVKGLIPVDIVAVVDHHSTTLEIRMKLKFFCSDVGQYVFINIPSISFFEWHPFTLSSCPEDKPEFSVHIRIVGDWTKALLKKVRAMKGDATKIFIAIDGPFGTASEDIFDYEVAMLVGSGIGVTPFASTLKSICHRLKNMNLKKLTKVYFYWICPKPVSFEWFAALLKTIENELETLNPPRPDFIEYDIYLTRGWTPGDAQAIQLHGEDTDDPITHLGAKTQFGRPKWDDIFTKIAEDCQGKKVGVFFCGPAALSRQLHQEANKHSDGNCNFSYNKETF